ncbi:hypothetical protein N7452_009117 [Penicillium brevicompactum]|uniref:DUF4267 domain-containing protein n=1 Tax=Penicillium brevicompactum TaxID=5074 RepID=A0A9W9U9S3_PENBR|nr:hypothetical protein N7452_009117 [Penicillium brevicompactum]
MSTKAYSTASNVGAGLALAFAALGTSVGISAFFADPLKSAATFGINIESTASASLPLVRAYSSRNIGSGVGILALLALGKRKSVGILLATGTLVMALDGWLVAQASGRYTAEALGHLSFIPVAILTSWLLSK